MSLVTSFDIRPETAPFLDVARSLGERAWRMRPLSESDAETIRRTHRLPDLAARLLAARGIGPTEAETFLDATLRTHFPNPSSFIDMDRAAAAIEDAIVTGRRVAVFADYDVDGATSAAQLVRYFRQRGRQLEIYVPDRLKEGYGPSALAFERLKAQGAELVITVDCGAAAHGPLEAAAALGLEVVVIDHHLMSGPPPRARAVVNPNRNDCESGQGHLTAAGVVLATLAAVNREARRRGSPGSNHLPDLLQFLDLAALGTVCDVAPLTGVNRAFVSQGIKVLARAENVGLKALCDVAGRQGGFSVYDLGFVLGPRLNAGGRIGDASIATRLLSTDDPDEAARLARELDSLNTERRALQERVVLDALAKAEDQAGASAIVVGDRTWHPGIIGIVAGRLKERFLTPTIVLGGTSEDEPGKGSGRSVTGVNLGRAVAQAAKEGLLIAGGGHAMAAGLTIDWRQEAAFREFLSSALAGEVEAAATETRTLHIDAVASIGGADANLMDALDRIGPYGPGHPDPVFAMPRVTVTFAQAAKGHVRFVLGDARGAKLKGIAFGAVGSPIGDALLAREGLFHAAVRLKRNGFGGVSRVEAELADLARAG